MKQTIALLLCLALIALPSVALSAPEDAAHRADGPGVLMRVTAVASCDDYNHVGNEWNAELYVDDSLVARYENDKLTSEAPEILLSAGATLCASARITEADRYSDVGCAEEYHTVTQADLADGFAIDFEVVVAENAGRYRRSAVTWSVQFTFANPSIP